MYPVLLLGDDDEVRASEVVRWGGVPFARTGDGWAVIEHVDLAGVVDREDD